MRIKYKGGVLKAIAHKIMVGVTFCLSVMRGNLLRTTSVGSI